MYAKWQSHVIPFKLNVEPFRLNISLQHSGHLSLQVTETLVFLFSEVSNDIKPVCSFEVHGGAGGQKLVGMRGGSEFKYHFSGSGRHILPFPRLCRESRPFSVYVKAGSWSSTPEIPLRIQIIQAQMQLSTFTFIFIIIPLPLSLCVFSFFVYFVSIRLSRL